MKPLTTILLLAILTMSIVAVYYLWYTDFKNMEKINLTYEDTNSSEDSNSTTMSSYNTENYINEKLNSTFNKNDEWQEQKLFSRLIYLPLGN